MGRPRSPHGYSASRWNRQTHAAEFHGILPSKGVERCYHSAGCPVAENDDLRHRCVPGEPCAFETALHHAYLKSARKSFSSSRARFSDDEFEGLITELSYCELRRMRIATLINRESLTRDKRHPISGYLIGQQIGLGVGRYSDAVDVRFNVAMDKLLGDYEPRVW
jgi:hypothetical protein